jgi:hypothetical protein
LVGRTSDAQQCEFVLLVLWRYMQRASDRARHEYYHANIDMWRAAGHRDVTWKMKGYRDTWLTAFVLRLAVRYEEERRALHTEAASTGVAMVRVSDLKPAQDWIDAAVKGKDLRNAGGLQHETRHWHSEGHRDGTRAANDVRLRSNAVAGGKTKGALR